ncbi:MAG: hypothetical protein R3E77_00840 [Steroidobacteraceae bacterium]
MPSAPIPVAFPLRGEWTAMNTPGHRLPSHGTDLLAQTYAHDFVRLDRQARGSKFFRDRSLLRYLVFGVPLMVLASFAIIGAAVERLLRFVPEITQPQRALLGAGAVRSWR